MALVDINWRPSPMELRVFAVLQLGFCALVAWLVASRFEAVRAAATIVGLAIVLAGVGVVAPQVLRPVYVAWMVAVLPIGWTVSHLAMAMVFYLVITPVGLIMRACGRDPMQRTIDRSAFTYWRPRTEDADTRRYFRQF